MMMVIMVMIIMVVILTMMKVIITINGVLTGSCDFSQTTGVWIMG